MKHLNSWNGQHGAEPADVFVQDAQGIVRQPTAREVSGLAYGPLRDIRVQAQKEVRGDFAHLLNRGSCLE